jgi:hypothetical protein
MGDILDWLDRSIAGGSVNAKTSEARVETNLPLDIDVARQGVEWSIAYTSLGQSELRVNGFHFLHCYIRCVCVRCAKSVTCDFSTTG